MFRHTISLGRIFGIRIDLDYSWFLIVGLLTWMLAAYYYPQRFRGWNAAEYWGMGLATAVMLFVSVLIHELGHSLVAKHLGMSVPRITLFIFGGVSQIAAEPPSAGAEFAMAIVGPLVSLALAAVFWELEPVVAFSGPLLALTEYLALLNFVLGIFNLVPGFPLDGGRVLRAIIWRFTGKYQRSTAIAAGVGPLLRLRYDLRRPLADSHWKFSQWPVDRIYRMVPGKRRGQPASAGRPEGPRWRTSSHGSDEARLPTHFS